MSRTCTLASTVLAVVATFPSAATIPATAAGETCDGKAATIVVPLPSPDTAASVPVTGTPGDDVIVGTDTHDTIDGADGNDTICALGGHDVVLGGPGDDRMFGGLNSQNYGDRIEPGPGDDFIDFGPDQDHSGLSGGPVSSSSTDQVSYRNATGPVRVDLAAGVSTGEGTDTIAPSPWRVEVEGSAHADHLLGTDSGDTLAAGGGDDTVIARGGDDDVWADQLTCNWATTCGPEVPPSPGDDVVQGGAGGDLISGGYGTDTLHGGKGYEDLFVDEGVATRAFGGAGDDFLNTGWWGGIAAGSALLAGGPGDDNIGPRLTLASDRVRVWGGAGRDHISVFRWAAAPRRGRVVVDGRVGTVRTEIGVGLRFSSIESYFLGIHGPKPVEWYGTWRDETVTFGDTMDGWPIAGRAFAGGGDDTIYGSSRRDLLDGGPGRDHLCGGEGRDRCLHGERLDSCELRR